MKRNMPTVRKYMRAYRWYVAGVAGLIFMAGIVYAGHYLYTGKGWLLFEGKESIPDFYYTRGMYYFGGGAYNLAVAEHSFEEALVYSKGFYPFAHYQLARIHFVQGHFSSALTEANAELANYPDHYRTHYVKGLIYGYRKQYIQAEEEFKTYIAQEPIKTWAGYNDLTWIYFSEGDYKNAAETALAGLAQNPAPSFAAWLENSYGVAEMNLGHYEIAQTYLEKAQIGFASMTPEQWGIAYPGNDPQEYAHGLEETRNSVVQNLSIVHSKLHSQ